VPTPASNPESTIEGLADRHVYFFGPFRFDSEIRIPELEKLPPASLDPRPVRIRLGGVPAALDHAQPYGNFAQVAPSEYLLDARGTARYYVRNGSEVRVDFAPGTPIANVSTYLLGSVFGALCHQNGFLPLHASAIEREGVVIAFLGQSGAGKSTLAACLQRRGHHVVSDDICLLEPARATPGPLRVIPVASWLKLWNQSLEFLGETPEEQHRVFSTDDKFRLYLPPAESPAQAPAQHLARVVFLEKSDATGPQAQSALQRLDPPTAIAGLMNMTYAPYIPALSGQDARAFRQCARVFQHAQAYRLTIPWGLDRVDQTLDLLERDLFRPLDSRT
jgi:energy-coupling factor transporter ATP-binding protein EcfA2